MRLYEFDRDLDRAKITKIVALTNQLKNDLDSGDIGDEFTTDILLDYFRKYNVVLDKTDLYSMIKVPPLNTVISNIQGDKVVFKGQDSGDEAPEDENKKVIAQMAKKAQK
jgi:hypothetical protein